MKPRDIIARSWALTKKETSIRRWAFAHSLFVTLLNAKLFFYQAWLAYSYFVLDDPIGFATMEKVIWENLPHWLSITIFVLFILLLVVEFIFPHMARGAIIGLAAKSYKKEEVKGGLVMAVYNFFPIFALHEILVLSSLTTVITLSSLALRYGGSSVGFIVIAILTTIWLVSTIIEFFWIFAEEAVVIKKAGIRDAIRQSVKLVLSYLGHIVFLLLLLFIIILRILANLVMVILVPAIVLGFGWFLSTLMPPAVSYSISAIVGLAVIIFASYLFAYIEVFRQTVWTITFMELSKMKDLDVIEVDK